MAYKPKQITDTNKNTADIINALRNDIGGDFKESVPVALKAGAKVNGSTVSREAAIMRLREIGNVITSYTPFLNAFTNALVNRIGRTIITSKLYYNPWVEFKKGLMELGDTVQEVFVNMAKPFQFSPETAENTWQKRHLPDIQSAYHSLNFQKYYPTTVSEQELRQAFLSWEGLNDLIGRIIEQVYTGANYDEFIIMKYMIARAALNGTIHAENIPAVTADNAREVTATMVKFAKDLTFMSNRYNEAGVYNFTDPNGLYIILTTDISSIFDVEVLALSFNMDKAELIGRQKLVDGFGTIDEDRLALLFADDPYTSYTPFTSGEKTQLATIEALMCDEKFFMIFDNLYEMRDYPNGEGLYWNYRYHVWKTFSMSPFANAILYTTSTPAVTSVTVTPSNTTANKGTTLQLSVKVETTGFASKGVHWEITGSKEFSTVDQNGLVTIGAGETEGTLTVKAISLFDEGKSGTCTITVNP